MPPLLEARGIGKAFPGVQALADVALSVEPGEILAVCGENGAGKSTLMKILGGVQVPDVGEIRIEGQPVKIRSVKEAERHGIVLIHQELNLATDLDVAGNVFLGREPTWGGPLGLIHSRINPMAAELTGRLGLACSPRTRVADLAVGEQQLVEIARALSLRSRILILDEPTSSLTERETALLFKVLADLKREGISIVYISHRLKEIDAIADRVVVLLRDGKNAGELAAPAEIGHDAIVRLMVGRQLKQFFQRNRPESQPDRPPVLEVRDLRWSPTQKHGIDLRLRAGEIVGMAGLMGGGRTETAETIFGVRRALTGSIAIDGRPVRIRSSAQAIAQGIFLIPEDRRIEGLVLSDSVERNLSLPNLDLVSRFGFVLAGKQRRSATAMVDRLRVRTPSVGQEVGLLSGGNQQKVVLGKWLERTPRVLILDEPTRGIDVGAKSEIYALMDRLAADGVAVLMISSDLEEILGMSDRVLVMHEGQLAGESYRASASGCPGEVDHGPGHGWRGARMKKLAGIALFLAVLYVLLLSAGEGAASYNNHFNLGQRIGLYGILTLGAGLVIVTGNIDLSMGSVVGVCSTVMCVLLIDFHWHPAAAIVAILVLGAVIGLVNGLLVTYLGVQAFVVTLCGMFIYRGLARRTTVDQATGLAGEFGDWKAFLAGNLLGVPMQLVILFVLLAIATVFLHFSVQGRYFYAIGSNDRAAKFFGHLDGPSTRSSHSSCARRSPLFIRSFSCLRTIPCSRAAPGTWTSSMRSRGRCSGDSACAAARVRCSASSSAPASFGSCRT